MYHLLEWNLFYLYASPLVLAVDCGLSETYIPSGEPTTHHDKDRHGYAMVVYGDKLYRSDQLGTPRVTS